METASAAAAAADAAGGRMEIETLGVYELKRLLGRGGMGSVYVAHDPRLSRDVALKVLSPELAKEREFEERFVSEAKSCSSLNHPNITTIHEIGEADGCHFIAFELVDGDTLEAVMSRDGKLAPERVVDLADQLGDALGYAHERGIVHRDLKPANVVLSARGVPKILDFGLAKSVAPDAFSPESETLARLTRAGMVVGTIAYMSPEQALGEAVDARSDIFSFGCLLFEMLTGAPPFKGASATQRVDNLLHQDPLRVDQLEAGIDSELADIIERALQKPVTQRYQRMDQLLSDLARVGHHRFASSNPAMSSIRRAADKRPALWTWGAVAASVAAAAALFVLEPLGGTAHDGDAVGVMYFENISDPEDVDQTASMLTELLSSKLAAVGDLEIVSRQRLHDVARSLGVTETVIDRRVATEVAEAAGLRTMVVGQVASAGERLLATTEIVDVASGRSITSHQALGTSSRDIFTLASSLGDHVTNELASGALLPTDDGPVTTNVDAYRHYVEGEVELHASAFEDAAAAFGEAVRVDPGFALAHHRLSIAARWMSDGALAHQAARRAMASVNRAPAHLRDIIEANALYQDGAFSRALPLLERVLERDPSEKEALYISSQIYVHSLRDGDPSRAIDIMERLLALDPEFHQVYDRLALSYAFIGDVDAARARMEEWQNNRPEEVDGLRAILATLEGQPEEALGFAQAFSWIEGPMFQATAAMMASRWDVARRLTEPDADEWRSDDLRAWSYRNRAVFHTYVGELELAASRYRQAGSASGLRTHEGGAGGVPASALQSLAELYLVSGEVGEARVEVENALAIQPESWRGLYYAGRFALADDDPVDAERYLDLIEALPAAQSSASAKLYRDALAAELLLYRGDTRRSVELFEQVVSRPLLMDWSSTRSSAGASLRDGLVRSLLAVGARDRARDAMEELLASGAERIDHPALYAHTLHRLGVLEMEAGDSTSAKRHLLRLIDLWGESDWPLDIVANAEDRLALLESRAGR